MAREGSRVQGAEGVLSCSYLWPWQGPPNFLRASALAEHIKPVVVIPEEAPEDEEPETLIEISTAPPAGEPAVSGPPLLHGGLGVTVPPSAPFLPLAWRLGVTVLCCGRWWLTSSIRRSDPPTAP